MNDPIYPSFKAADWQEKEASLCQPLLNTGTNLPLIGYGFDSPESFAFMTTNDASISIDEAHLQALATLKEVDATWEVQKGDVKILACTGGYFSSEKILDVAFMLQAQEILNCNKLLAGIPHKGSLYVTNAEQENGELELFSTFVEEANSAEPSTSLTDQLLMIENGRITSIWAEDSKPVETKTTNPSDYQKGEWGKNNIQLDRLSDAIENVRREIGQVIIGQHELVDLTLAALLSGGHVLIEGVPGIAKTLTAKLLAKTLKVDFTRLQFTPDLMPSDVVGTTVFNMKTSEFSFSQGPIFSNVVLIDEINRAPAKTQASLFEVMEEKQVSVDGETYKMTFPFMVIATQNPIEQEGTYKLPEAQLDRFLFRIKLHYPSLTEEQQILKRFREDFDVSVAEKVGAVLNPEEIKACQDIVQSVFIKDELLDYIAAIVHNTRNNGDLYLGASPRASLAILKTAKAIAAMNGRDFVTPDDIQYVAYPVLNHRIILTPEREMEGFEPEDIIKDIIKKLEVPR